MLIYPSIVRRTLIKRSGEQPPMKKTPAGGTEINHVSTSVYVYGWEIGYHRVRPTKEGH